MSGRTGGHRVHGDAAGFAAQNRMLIQLFGGMFATMVIGFVDTIAS